MRLKRRGRMGRLLFWAIAIAAIVAVFLIARCGGGFGFGKGGLGVGGGSSKGVLGQQGSGTGTGTGREVAPARCMVRVDGTGIQIDGKPSTVDEVIAACKVATAGADVVVAGDARQGTWEELRAALDANGIASLVRGAGAPVVPDAGIAAPAAPDSGP
ncbi:MAG TPA: hypothetical protein VM261_37345 [Kofleriaceae bacterium]|nr:hypothetical protein [Kofleriaceae bacterium]